MPDNKPMEKEDREDPIDKEDDEKEKDCSTSTSGNS